MPMVNKMSQVNIFRLISVGLVVLGLLLSIAATLTPSYTGRAEVKHSNNQTDTVTIELTAFKGQMFQNCQGPRDACATLEALNCDHPKDLGFFINCWIFGTMKNLTIGAIILGIINLVVTALMSRYKCACCCGTETCCGPCCGGCSAGIPGIVQAWMLAYAFGIGDAMESAQDINGNKLYLETAASVHLLTAAFVFTFIGLIVTYVGSCTGWINMPGAQNQCQQQEDCPVDAQGQTAYVKMSSDMGNGANLGNLQSL